MNEEKELYSKEAVLNLSSVVIKYFLKAMLELLEDPDMDDFPSDDLANLVQNYIDNIPDEEDFIIEDIAEYLKNDSEFMNDANKFLGNIEDYEKQKEKRFQEKENIFEDEGD